MTTPETFNYTGTDNLEAMAGADNYNRYLLDLVRHRVQARERVIDVGAGIGTFAATLRAEGLDVLCVEPDARQADVIRRAGMPVVTSIEQVADASIDLAYSFNVMEHIEDDVAALRSIRGKLRPGGRVLIYVPAFQLLFTDMDRLVGHVRRYRAGELADKLQRAGFRVTSARYADSLGFLATLVYKWTDRSAGHINPKALMIYDSLVFPVSRLLDRLGLRKHAEDAVFRVTSAGFRTAATSSRRRRPASKGIFRNRT